MGCECSFGRAMHGISPLLGDLHGDEANHVTFNQLAINFQLQNEAIKRETLADTVSAAGLSFGWPVCNGASPARLCKQIRHSLGPSALMQQGGVCISRSMVERRSASLCT